jgi:2,3-dihydroxyphenylpropionate 1,2-dioxygenase
MGKRIILGISHSPLWGVNPVANSVKTLLDEAAARIKEKVNEFSPELVVIISPDHYHGFFNEMMPPFCIGTEANSVGDYLTSSGSLNVDAQSAVALADYLMDLNFDIAVSRRMRVDHGFAQPLDVVFGGLKTPPIIPIFMNAVAPPGIPRLRRCRALGEALGKFLDADPRRTLLIGSGGLSHEPPVPKLTDPNPQVRERITVGRPRTHAEQEARMKLVSEAGMALAAGKSQIKPLNPDWDKHWMTAISSADSALESICSMSEAGVALEGGNSAHESKTWLVCRSAMRCAEPPRILVNHYQAIPEYIAGFGMLLLQPTE